MTEQEYFKLLNKYEEGLTSDKEERLLDAYYNLYNLREDGIEQLDEQEYSQLMAVIKESIDHRISTEGIKQKRFSLWPKATIAAAFILSLGIGFWFFNLYYKNNISFGSISRTQYINDIKPGKNTASLKLPDGTIMDLSDAKSGVIIDASTLKYSDGTAVAVQEPNLRSKSSNGETNDDVVVKTPRGGTYQVTLPDGTQVWLNSASELTFPTKFIGNKRKVQLKGEAYFEVATIFISLDHKEKQAFVVESKGQQVEVLGTHFNINAFEDESGTETTLLQGSVRVSTLRAGAFEGNPDRVELNPGQQSILSNTNQGNQYRFTVKKVDVSYAVAWKNGLFQFYRADLKTVMQQFARWYDVDVSFEGEMPKREFTGKIYRNIKASQALDLLKNLDVKFRIEGRKIIVTP